MIRHLILLHSSNMNLIHTNKYWQCYMDQYQKLSKNEQSPIRLNLQIPGPPPPLTEQKYRTRARGSGNTSPYPARPMDGGVRGAGEEALGVEEGAHAPERNADHDRRGDAGPARQRLPAAAAAAAHQGRLPPAGHLPLRVRRPPRSDEMLGGGDGVRLVLADSFIPFPGGSSFGGGVRVTATLVFLGRRALDWDGRTEDGEVMRSGIRQTGRR
jgi:hypothetical protein